MDLMELLEAGLAMGIVVGVAAGQVTEWFWPPRWALRAWTGWRVKRGWLEGEVEGCWEIEPGLDEMPGFWEGAGWVIDRREIEGNWYEVEDARVYRGNERR